METVAHLRTIKVVQVVPPNDGTESLPIGEYEVEASSCRLVSASGNPGDPSSWNSVLTFVVASGFHRSGRRRIAVVEGRFGDNLENLEDA